LGVSGEPRTDGICRTEVGREVGSFYGYVSEGIFQSQDEIDNRVNAEGEYINQNGAQPGDVIYADLNNDGEITNADQKFLGSGWQKFISD
jgi:TonB-dependent starch-binding outer membrane protein SusC